MHAADGAEGRSLRCVATDGHRLARIDRAPAAGRRQSARRDRGRARRWASSASFWTMTRRRSRCRSARTKVRFATPEVTLTSKVIDGSFPDYSRVIPSGQHPAAVGGRQRVLARRVDRVSTVSSERSRAVKLSLDEDRLVLSVNSPDSGAARGGTGGGLAAPNRWRSASTPNTCRKSPIRWTGRTPSSCSTPPAIRR